MSPASLSSSTAYAPATQRMVLERIDVATLLRRSQDADYVDCCSYAGTRVP